MFMIILIRSWGYVSTGRFDGTKKHTFARPRDTLAEDMSRTLLVGSESGRIITFPLPRDSGISGGPLQHRRE